jgi:hypothetical protein
MKKLTLLIIAVIVGTITANAQIGGLLEKAAKKAQKKTEEKIIDKASDKASEQISNAVADQIPEEEATEDPAYTVDENEPLTYEGVMRMMPPVPSVQQMVSYKKAEYNGQGLRQLSSPLMKFQMTVLELTAKVYTIPVQGADSAEIVDNAYKYAEMYTGLSKEEIDMLSTMSEEEQDAYLAEHYQEGQAEAVLLQQAAEVGEELEPLQPMIDHWTSFDDRIAEVNKDADSRCKAIYAKYEPQLKKAEGDDEARNKVLLKYYEEVAPIIRDAIISSNKIRLDEQLPVAMELEEQIIPIRQRHPNALTALLNYPQLTAVQYFTEALRVMDIPEYPNE